MEYFKGAIPKQNGVSCFAAMGIFKMKLAHFKGAIPKQNGVRLSETLKRIEIELLQRSHS